MQDRDGQGQQFALEHAQRPSNSRTTPQERKTAVIMCQVAAKMRPVMSSSPHWPLGLQAPRASGAHERRSLPVDPVREGEREGGQCRDDEPGGGENLQGTPSVQGNLTAKRSVFTEEGRTLGRRKTSARWQAVAIPVTAIGA